MRGGRRDEAAVRVGPAELTLAAPSVNRHQKSGKDTGEWLPKRSRCWFSARIVAVKRKYGLTVDAREAYALESVLSGCASTEMVVAEGPGPAAKPAREGTGGGAADALGQWDTNGNGRITCKEARHHGIAPVRREHRPTGSCATGTETGWSANRPVETDRG